MATTRIHRILSRALKTMSDLWMIDNVFMSQHEHNHELMTATTMTSAMTLVGDESNDGNNNDNDNNNINNNNNSKKKKKKKKQRKRDDNNNNNNNNSETAAVVLQSTRNQKSLEQELRDFQNKYELKRQQVRVLFKCKMELQQKKEERDATILWLRDKYEHEKIEKATFLQEISSLEDQIEQYRYDLSKTVFRCQEKDRKIKALSRYKMHYRKLKQQILNETSTAATVAHSNLTLQELDDEYDALYIDSEYHDDDAAHDNTPSEYCILCCENPMTSVLIPCGHQICCHECSQRLDKCPICTARCSSLRVFRS